MKLAQNYSRFSISSNILRNWVAPIMADQKKISSFFEPLASKRACQADNVPRAVEDTNQTAKKAKLSEKPADQENHPTDPPCSPKANGVTRPETKTLFTRTSRDERKRRREVLSEVCHGEDGKREEGMRKQEKKRMEAEKKREAMEKENIEEMKSEEMEKREEKDRKRDEEKKRAEADTKKREEKKMEENRTRQDNRNEEDEKKREEEDNTEEEKRQKTGEGEKTRDKMTGKKMKKNKSEIEEKKAPTSPLSPEQKERCEDNRRKAEMKVWEKKTHGLLTCVGDTWFTALKAEFSKPYFMKMSEFVAAERKKATIFPPSEQVFSWTQVCPIRQVKVVILGQDPYHGPKQAHGLCFSVQPGVATPPSLVNMYKELESDIPGFKRPSHGYLMGWATQGVLLLNACLTVRAHQANSHKDQGWEKLTDAVISWINNNLDGVVFLLWGAYAQKKGACINKKKHHILKSVHPSPLSAHRGFLGCKHFSQCNELLKKQSKKPIDWTDLPLE